MSTKMNLTERTTAALAMLDARKAVVDAATPGEWESADPGPLRQCRDIFAPGARYIGTIDNSDGHDTHGPDAAFIAASRNERPGELDALRTAIVEWKYCVDHFQMGTLALTAILDSLGVPK